MIISKVTYTLTWLASSYSYSYSSMSVITPVVYSDHVVKTNRYTRPTIFCAFYIRAGVEIKIQFDFSYYYIYPKLRRSSFKSSDLALHITSLILVHCELHGRNVTLHAVQLSLIVVLYSTRVVEDRFICFSSLQGIRCFLRDGCVVKIYRCQGKNSLTLL